MSVFDAALQAFDREFRKPSPRLFRAPGRVNLIGEHTDYNQGFVLPMAIDREVAVAARRRPDREVQVYSLDFDRWSRFHLDAVVADPEATWANYVRGMAWSLQADGHPLLGMDAAITGNVPVGSGLSSSAAIEVATGYALLRLAGLEVDHLNLALAAQRAENDFVGMHSGIMDQMISSLGQAGHALLIDCRDLSYRAVPIPSEAAVVVVDSGMRRGLVESEYNARREECEEAARLLGVQALRDVDFDTFEARADELAPVVRRRARHVITENARTVDAADALERSDLATVGQLMDASHASLRDDFEVSTPELDLLVTIAHNVDGVYGARLTGAGFGGCIVALARRDATGAVSTAIEQQYPLRSGRKATVYICQASEGASEVDI